ncbi:hypothetical protein AMELA_G00124210 [Ameiurus melas]|uniref:Uncharacterized protein n=1 Tax=Ameiurus melas TaxID=219545 RepID=A0A7J6AMH7_AMEME|nr:hypothetical protein AMELA_G00124210 [Ameiurus melas]
MDCHWTRAMLDKPESSRQGCTTGIVSRKPSEVSPKISRRTEEGHPNSFQKSQVTNKRIQLKHTSTLHVSSVRSVELTLLPKFKGTGAQRAGFVQAYLPGGCCLSGVVTVGCFHYVPTVFVPCSQRSQPTVQHFPSLRLPAVLSSWESLRACPSTGTLPSN